MGLRVSKGNMYTWVTHQWSTIKGQCYHDCSYCFMKQWGPLKPIRFDSKELNTDLGSDNIIFVNDSNDMFAEQIPREWIRNTLNHCNKYKSTYLFQTKNPQRISTISEFPARSLFCTTIETNRHYSCMNNCPSIEDRVKGMMAISQYPKYITIEPIMDFDLKELVTYIKSCSPQQVNIGADSKGNNLPEPSKDKILNLIDELKKFTVIDQKRNLDRLLK